MKCAAVGDIHGRDAWKAIVDRVNEFDKIIFVGDYVDSYDLTNGQIIRNLLEIIAFRREHPDKVVLLTGNHDISYMFWEDTRFRCQGIRPESIHDLMTIFRGHKDVFDAAFQVGNTIITHAGITNGWYEFNKEYINDASERFDSENLADTLNFMLRVAKFNGHLHQIGKGRQGGIYEWGGITWADKTETEVYALSGFKQVVGHTPVPTITTVKGKDFEITYCDCLAITTQFYEFEVN